MSVQVPSLVLSRYTAPLVTPLSVATLAYVTYSRPSGPSAQRIGRAVSPLGRTVGWPGTCCQVAPSSVEREMPPV